MRLILPHGDMYAQIFISCIISVFLSTSLGSSILRSFSNPTKQRKISTRKQEKMIRKKDDVKGYLSSNGYLGNGWEYHYFQDE